MIEQLLWFPVFVLIFSSLIIAHEAGHFYAARRCGVKVEEFGVGFGKRLCSWRWSGTLFTINLIPFGGFVRLHDEEGKNSRAKGSFAKASLGARMLITLGGVLVNYAIFVAIIGGLYTVGTNPILVSQTEVVTAYEQGVIDFAEPDESGKRLIIWKEKVKYPVWQAFPMAVKDSGRIASAILSKVAEIPLSLWHSQRLPDDLMGPVGIAQTVKIIFPQGVENLVRLAAMLSLSLAIMNLLPIPALDGGRLFFQLIELVIRRPIPSQVEAYVHTGGFLLLLGLLLLITWQDVVSWFF